MVGQDDGLGLADGPALGDADGPALGDALALADGPALGDVLGLADGLALGDPLALGDGLAKTSGARVEPELHATMNAHEKNATTPAVAQADHPRLLMSETSPPSARLHVRKSHRHDAGKL